MKKIFSFLVLTAILSFTAAGKGEEKENLFTVIDRLKKEGKAIIYITHFLDEVMGICDKFVVLRNGKIHGQGKIKDIAKTDIVKMIIGRDIAYDQKSARTIADKPVLKVENIKSGLLYNETPGSVRHEIDIRITGAAAEPA